MKKPRRKMQGNIGAWAGQTRLGQTTVLSLAKNRIAKKESKQTCPYSADGAIVRKGGGLLFGLGPFRLERTLTEKNASN
jgi:hypothetical protein